MDLFFRSTSILYFLFNVSVCLVIAFRWRNSHGKNVFVAAYAIVALANLGFAFLNVVGTGLAMDARLACLALFSILILIHSAMLLVGAVLLGEPTAFAPHEGRVFDQPPTERKKRRPARFNPAEIPILNELQTDRESLRMRLANEANAYFAKLENVRGESGVNVSQQMGVTIMDFTTDKEKKIEQDARTGAKIGPSFDAIATALQEIGAAREYTIIDADPLWGTSEYDGRTQVIAHEIGKILNDAGGIDFMQCAYYRIKANGGDARDLERNWDGIGKWRG